MADSKTAPQAKDFMTRQVRCLSPAMSLAEIIAFLEKHEISSAPVVEETDHRKTLVGFVSERDCLEFLANESFYGFPAPPQTAQTIMRKHPVCVSPETDLFALASIFISHGFRHLPVVENGVLQGIVSRRDILKAMDVYYQETNRAKDKQRNPPNLHEIMQHRFIVGK